jgi:hypothetical protein
MASLQYKLGLPLPDGADHDEGFRRLQQLQANPTDEAFTEFRRWVDAQCAMQQQGVPNSTGLLEPRP